MPYRDRATVQRWVDEYLVGRGREALEIDVLDKNFEAGPNSGIIVVSLRTVSTITYAQPVIQRGAPRWLVTFEPRSEALDLDADELQKLADDIGVLREMCVFLQGRTDAALLGAKASA